MFRLVNSKNATEIIHAQLNSDFKSGLPYIIPQWLDTVAQHWGSISFDPLNSSLFPVTYKTFLGCKIAMQPPFTQLTTFIGQPLPSHSLAEALLKYFGAGYIQTDVKITHPSFSTIERNNYIINLNAPYAELLKNFTPRRRALLRKSANCAIYNSPLADYMLNYVHYYQKQNVSNKGYNRLANLIDSKPPYYTFQSYLVRVGNETVAGALFVITSTRIIYLSSFSNDLGRQMHAITAIINKIIEQYAGLAYIFDFEGGTIGNLSDFFVSFGAEKTHYYYTSWVTSDFRAKLYRWLRSLK